MTQFFQGHVMTVTSSQQDVTYITDGTSSPHTIPFYFLEDEDIRADLIGSNESVVSLVYGTDFTLSGAGNESGGSLTPLNVWPSGQKLHIYRIVPVTQDREYQQNDPFPAKTTEQALDKLTMIDQQLSSSVFNAIRYPESEFESNGELPIATQRAGMIIGFDAAGVLSLMPLPSSLGAGDLRIDEFVAGVDFTPDVTNKLTLSRAPLSDGNCWAYWDGVPQLDFSLNDTEITFPTPIPEGIQTVHVRIGTTLSVGIPASGSVGDAAIASGSKLENRIRDLATVTDFGAIGDGIFDNAPAFAAAAASRSGPIIVPSGGRWKSGSATLFGSGMGLYDDQSASQNPGYNSFHSLRYSNSNADTNQHANISAQTEISSGSTMLDIGVLSVLNIHSNAQQHVGMYSQVNVDGASNAFYYGGCIEVGNVQADGSSSTVNQALVGLEIDMKSKYGYDGTDAVATRKTAYSAVAWGGGSIHEAYSVYSSGEKNGDGATYQSGDFVFGLKIRKNALNVASGVGVDIDSDHADGIRITGKSAVYGINLNGAAVAGNIGLYIGAGYATPIAIEPNKIIRMNGAANPEGMYYDSVAKAIIFQSETLAVSGHTGSPTAGALVGYLSVYVNGTLQRIPYYEP